MTESSGVVRNFREGVPGRATIRYDTLRYGTILRLKADISQLTLPHGTKNQKRGKEKKLKMKIAMLRSIGKQYGGSMESVLKRRRKRRLRREVFAEKGGSQE